MSSKTIRVLSIEDSPADAMLIQESLVDAQRVAWGLPRFEVEHVGCLETALNRLGNEEFDVVLSDLDLPDSKADKTVAKLREHIPRMPLVVLTGREDEALARESVRAGVQDYLYKEELTGSLLARTMLYAIERQQARDGLKLRVDERTSELQEANEELRRANQALEAEVAKRKRTEEQITRLNQCFSSLGKDARENIDLIVETAGEILGGACLLYNRLEKERSLLCTWSIWHRPEGYNPADNPEGHICYDVIVEGGDQPVIIEDLQGTRYEKTDPNVKKYGLKSYLGYPVRLRGETVGSFCLCDIRRRKFTDQEIKIMGMLAEAVATEEERRQAEEALRHKTQEQTLLLETIPTHVWYLTDVDKYGAVNRAHAEFLGVEQGELEQNSLCEVLGEEEAKVCIAGNEKAFAAKEQIHTEEWIKNGEGEPRLLSITKTPKLAPSGEVEYVVCAAEDITERKRVEKALLESEERYRSLLEAIPDSVYFLDYEWRHMIVNQAATEFVQLPRETLEGGKLTELFPGVEETIFFKTFQKVMETREPDTVFDEYTFEDGRKGWYEVRIYPVLEGILCISRDITERKLMEEALRVRLRYEKGLTACSQTLQANEPESLIDALQHLLEATGVSRVYVFENFVDDDDLCMRQIAEVCAPGIDSQIDNPQLQHLSYGEAAPGLVKHLSSGDYFERHESDFTPEDWEILAPQGIRSLLILPIQVGGEWYGHIGFDDCEQEREWQSQDIHLLHTAAEMIGRYIEHRQAEEKIRGYAAELERSNQELEQFAYAVSHDLQAPLRVVKSYLRLLDDRCGDQLAGKAEKYVKHSRESAERMEDMIGVLLNLSRVDTRGRELAPTDCELVLEHVLADLALMIEESGAKVTHDPLPTVMADEVQLAHVFQNLISNGIKFQREGERPRVHVSVSLREEGESGQEREWLFSVEDNGIGIDPQQAEYIFQVFQRLHTAEEYPGLGMGLALCKRIVKRHGGDIWVDSEGGGGSTFSFTIPV